MYYPQEKFKTGKYTSGVAKTPAPRLPEEVHTGLQGTERLSSFHSRPGHQHRVGPGFHFIYCLKLAPGETGPFPRAEKG